MEAFDFHHILQAIGDPQMAFVVDFAYIASVEPAFVVESFVGGCLVVEVAGHVRWRSTIPGQHHGRKQARGDSLPYQDLAFEALSYDLGGFIDRHNLELDAKAWHASVAELGLDDFPCLAYLVTDRSRFRQTIALGESVSARLEV